MKEGRSLQELAAEIDRQSKTKRDFEVHSKDMVVHTNGHTNVAVADKGTFEVNDIAHSQLANRLDVPKKYYDRLREHGDLFDTTVNTLLQRDSDVRLVRTLDGRMRADLSRKYRTLDNDDAATAILSAVSQHEVVVASCEVTERKLYIKALSPRVEFKVEGYGKLLGVGTFTNSEVGQGNLSAEFGVWNEWCSNLAIRSDDRFKKTHIGAKSTTDFDQGAVEFFRDDTRRASDAAFWLQFRDFVDHMFDPDNFRKFVEHMKESREQPLDSDVSATEVIELTRKQFTLTESEGENILVHLIQGKEMNKFGLANAITRASQDIPNYDRATELERLGGKVFELPRAKWKELGGV